MDDPLVAAALEILAEPEADLPPPDYTAGLTPAQLEALQVIGEPFAMLWARRTGKTYTIPRMLLRSAEKPGTWSVYLTKTRKNAKLLLWRWLKKAARELRIPHRVNETDLVLDVENGGSILLGGADDLAAIERWRQFGWSLAVVDEMGTYSEAVITSLIDDVLQPACADHGGQLVYSGTPGYTLGGRWHQISGDNSRIRVLRADARSNTAVPGIWDRILAIKEANGWADDHPTWIREYLGQWVQDEGALVFPFELGRNGANTLPRIGRTGADLHPAAWRFVMGVDVGYVHASAIVIMASHPQLPEEYVVHAEKHTELLPRQLAERLRAVRAEVAARLHVPPRALERAPVVMDTGGMGKVHAEECRRVYALPVEPAEKRDKESAVRLLRGDLLSGMTKVLSWPHCDPLREEWARLGWDEERRLPHKDHSSAHGGLGDHASDACLYAKRRLRHFRDTDPAYPKARTEREELRMLEHAEELAAREHGRKRRGRYVWDR